jgi:uncharacterized phage protein gp47/JayE
MAYQVPTLEEFLGFLVAMFKGLLPDRNIGTRFAPAWKFVKTIAGAGTDVHAHVDARFKDVMPNSARGAALDEWIAIKAPGGTTTRKGATGARKAAAGRVRGTLGATSAVGDQLIHRASGLMFQINSAVTIPAALYFDADIAAIDTGSKTRLKAGEVLEYLVTPAGLQTQVELQLDLDGDGQDQELDGAARNRLLAAFSAPTAGGNQADYVAWALAQVGIAQAFCYQNRAGLGTVDVAALHSGSGSARILTNTEATALLAVLQTLCPAQVINALRVLTAIGGNTDAANLANVEITVTPDGSPQYLFDWDDTTAPTVLAYTAATRLLQFAGGTRPGTMQAGHRIVLKGVASSQDGTPYVIEALSGADSVILQTALTVNAAATDIVYAGGPLTKPIRDAILAHINGDTLYAGPTGPLPGATADSTVGLQVLADGIGTANPAGLYGSWRGGLLRGTLAQIAMYTRGVRNQNVIAPAADLEAVDYAFPVDNQIGLLTPGYVLVRRG